MRKNSRPSPRSTIYTETKDYETLYIDRSRGCSSHDCLSSRCTAQKRRLFPLYFLTVRRQVFFRFRFPGRIQYTQHRHNFLSPAIFFKHVFHPAAAPSVFFRERGNAATASVFFRECGGSAARFKLLQKFFTEQTAQRHRQRKFIPPESEIFLGLFCGAARCYRNREFFAEPVFKAHRRGYGGEHFGSADTQFRRQDRARFRKGQYPRAKRPRHSSRDARAHII